MTAPRVTVLMAAHDASAYLPQSLMSVLDQRSVDLELVVVNDGSTDDTPHLLASFTDARLRVIHSAVNVGPAAARNLGLQEARGDYVAVLDADDWALPERFSMQAALLDRRPDVDLVGGGCLLVGADGEPQGNWRPLEESAQLMWRLVLHNAFIHSAVMYRRDAALSAGGYDERLVQAEDYSLWCRMAERGGVSGDARLVSARRMHAASMTRGDAPRLRNDTVSVVTANLQRLLGLDISRDLACSLAGMSDASAGASSGKEACAVYESALAAMVRSRGYSAREIESLLPYVLADLQAIAVLDDEGTLPALQVARRIFRHTTLKRMSVCDAARLTTAPYLPSGLRPLVRFVTPQDDRRRSVAHVGPYPPPYGGVSAHIRRLHERLLAVGIESVVYCQHQSEVGLSPTIRPAKASLASRPRLLLEALRMREGIIHCHEGWLWALPMALQVLRGKDVVMTLHNQEVARAFRGSAWHRRAAVRYLTRSRRVHWIAVSAAVSAQLVEIGADRSRIQVIPAFISPVIPGTVPPELPVSLAEFAAAHAPLLSTYGWRCAVDRDGRDLYGFDTSIMAVAELTARYPEIGLVVLIPQPDNEPALAVLRNLIARLDLENAVLLCTCPLDDATPLWAATDVYLRPTTTDGDAVSVREALALGASVVASDACLRPERARVFRLGDLDAFVTAITECLAGRENDLRGEERPPSPDYFEDVLDVYSSVLQGRW